MAVTSDTIFYADYINGSDTARTTLTNATASNPSGTITRITYNNHGLTDGAAVRLTNFSAWLNAGFTIENVTTNTFDLKNTPWQTTADATGDITPLGGSSWADAWRSPGGTTNSTVITAGCDIRIAKSLDPISIGNATWTKASATVTLATAQTTTLYLDGAWTAANTATSTTNTTRKEGVNCAQITTPAATAINTKYAYLTIGGAGGFDLSTYDAITFWIKFINTAPADANRWVMKLCSDTTGDTAVDEFPIQRCTRTGDWIPYTLTRTGGGALGNAIKSIAIYTGATSPGNTQQIHIDNVSACDNVGVNLHSLISKSAHPKNMDEHWYRVDIINGTTLTLGTITTSWQQNSGNASQGYATIGTSPATVTTYVLNPIVIPYTTTTTRVSDYRAVGTATNKVRYLGGWNTTNTTQDGFSWFMLPYAAFNNMEFFAGSVTNNLYFEKMGFTGFTYAIQAQSDNNEFKNLQFTNAQDQNIWRNGNTSIGSVVDTCFFTSVAGPFWTNNGAWYKWEIKNIQIYSNLYNNNVTMSGSKFFKWSNITIMNNYAGLLGYTTDSSYDGIYIYELGPYSNYFQPNARNTYNNIVISGPTSNTGRAINTNTGLEYLNCDIKNLSITGTLSVKLVISAQSTTMKIQNFSFNTGSIYQVDNINFTDAINSSFYFGKVNNNVDDNRAYFRRAPGQQIDASVISQTTVRKSATGIAWQMSITNTRLDATLPFEYELANVAVNANSLVTIKCWLKKSHATDIAGGLLVKKDSLAGITSNVQATVSNTTNWEEVTVSFTPTEKGVVQVYGLGWWLANAADESVYFDDMTITQA